MDERERQARRNAVAAISKLAIAYDKELTDERIDLYIDALYDLDSSALARAVSRVISTERYFPTVAVLREAAFREEDALTPEEAWGAVCDHMRTYGRLRGARGLSDEIRRSVDACGGWMALCDSTNPTGDRITFVKVYTAMRNRKQREQAERWATPPEVEGLLRQIGKGEI